MKPGFFLSVVVLVLACGNPNDAGQVDRLIEQAWAAFESGDYQQAEVTFTEALNRDAGRMEAHSGLGWTRAFQRDYQQAIDTWKMGLEFDSTFVDIHAGLCMVYQIVKEFDACIREGSKVVAANPNYAFPHHNRVNIATIRGTMASAYYALGQFDQAASLMDQADPDNAPHSSDPKSLLTAIMNFLGLR